MGCRGATPVRQVTRVVDVPRDPGASLVITPGRSRLAFCPYCPPYSKGTLGIGLPGPSRCRCYSRGRWSEAMTGVQEMSGGVGACCGTSVVVNRDGKSGTHNTLS